MRGVLIRPTRTHSVRMRTPLETQYLTALLHAKGGVIQPDRDMLMKWLRVWLTLWVAKEYSNQHGDTQWHA